VAHLEGADGAEDVQRHVGDLAGVAVPVALGQPRGHHVGVADGLHLSGVAAGEGTRWLGGATANENPAPPPATLGVATSPVSGGGDGWRWPLHGHVPRGHRCHQAATSPWQCHLRTLGTHHHFHVVATPHRTVDTVTSQTSLRTLGTHHHLLWWLRAHISRSRWPKHGQWWWDHGHQSHGHLQGVPKDLGDPSPPSSGGHMPISPDQGDQSMATVGGSVAMVTSKMSLRTLGTHHHLLLVATCPYFQIKVTKAWPTVVGQWSWSPPRCP